MNENEKIRMLLELQEHPEQISETSLKQMLKDEEMRELTEQLATAKRAFVKWELRDDFNLVNDEWAKFEFTHFQNQKTVTAGWLKMAASFIGVLLASGIAFAAIHIVGQAVRGDMKSPAQEVRMPDSPQPIVQADTIKADSIPTESRIFDNVLLDQMLEEVAAYYSDSDNPITVEFKNEDARQFRFYFVWRKEEGLDGFIKAINHFESVSIRLENNKLIVE